MNPEILQTFGIVIIDFMFRYGIQYLCSNVDMYIDMTIQLLLLLPHF